MSLAKSDCCTVHTYYLSMHMRFFVFFFSSRRRHTRCSRDWSSDVCSSDLGQCGENDHQRRAVRRSHRREHAPQGRQIGRASCRGRGEISVGAVSLKKKKTEGKQKRGDREDMREHGLP